jgi:hypothetical protein
LWPGDLKSIVSHFFLRFGALAKACPFSAALRAVEGQMAIACLRGRAAFSSALMFSPIRAFCGSDVSPS